MITVFTTFTLPKPISRDEARSIFLSTAPKYRGVQGLFRKIYVLSQDGATVGGVYLSASVCSCSCVSSYCLGLHFRIQ